MKRTALDLFDVVMGLAQRAAIADPLTRRVLLTEARIRLANAGDGEERRLLEAELARMAEAA